MAATPPQPKSAMDGDPEDSSPKSEVAQLKEDADTAAARKELKHTVISADKSTDDAAAGRSSQVECSTPDETREDELKESIASPKKKRARDQLDEGAGIDTIDASSDVSSDSAKDRASRLEPEKKRVRDKEAADAAEPGAASTENTDKTKQPTGTESNEQDKPPAESLPSKTEPAAQDGNASKDNNNSDTGSSFGSSGFAKLASSTTSPFGSLGGSALKGSVLGGSGFAPSSFAAVAPSKAAAPAPAHTPMPTLSFGQSSGASPFAAVKSGANGFGSVFGSGGGFGSVLGSKPLSSFAKPGETLKSEKPAKPFGAPESDAEDESQKDESDDESTPESDEQNAKDESDKEDAKASDDKKKSSRLQRISVNDGEAGEATILAVRSKIFSLDKDQGWTERGSGMLKINVPESCVSFQDGSPVPGSFDASGMDEPEEHEESSEETAGSKVVRLIMRQDNTHRMLLNTIVFPALEFQQKTTLKTVGIIFTAFEGAEGKPVSIHAKMSAPSAKSFLNEIGIIQRELSDR